MWLPDFFYSKTFKIITTVIISVNLMIIITLKINGHTDMTDRDDECELGYWLGIF